MDSSSGPFHQEDTLKKAGVENLGKNSEKGGVEEGAKKRATGKITVALRGL